MNNKFKKHLEFINIQTSRNSKQINIKNVNKTSRHNKQTNIYKR